MKYYDPKTGREYDVFEDIPLKPLPMPDVAVDFDSNWVDRFKKATGMLDWIPTKSVKSPNNSKGKFVLKNKHKFVYYNKNKQSTIDIDEAKLFDTVTEALNFRDLIPNNKDIEIDIIK